MKHQSYIRSLFVALCAFFVCASALAGELNPFAFKLSSELVGDVFNVNYYLNAPATSVKVTITLPNDQKVVYDCTDSLNTSRTSKVKGIYKLKISLREYINNNPDFRGKTDLPWSVDVMGGNTATYPTKGNGQTLEAKKVTSYSYNFYSPFSVDIDNDPYSDNFGYIFMVEKTDGNAITLDSATYCKYYGWHNGEKYTDKNDGNKIKWKKGTYKGGLYSFDPAFQNIPTMNSEVGESYDFVNYNLANVKKVRRDASMNANSSGAKGAWRDNELFGRVRIAYESNHKNRIFMSFTPQSVANDHVDILLGEILTDNFPHIGKKGNNDWFTTVIDANTANGNYLNSTVNKSNFVMGPNIVFDVNGNGSALKLLMCSGNYLNVSEYNRENYRCDEYKLQTLTNGPSNEKVMNMHYSDKPDDTNWWYSNNQQLVKPASTRCAEEGHVTNGICSGCKYCKGTESVGFSNTFQHRGLEYDPDGEGFWHVQYREGWAELPSIVHFKLNGTRYEVNFAEYVVGRNGAGIRYDNQNERLLVTGGRFIEGGKAASNTYYNANAHLAKNPWPYGVSNNYPQRAVAEGWATIYTINQKNLNANMINNNKETLSENRKKVFTDSVYLNVEFGIYDAAWDYADNVYITGTTAHEFSAFALPHAGKTASTPCKTNYYFDTPTQSVKIQITPNKSCGNVVDHDCPQMIQHWRNAEPNAFDYYYLADDADVKTDPNNEIKVKFQLEARPAAGYRFYTWDNIVQDKALKSVTTVQNVSDYTANGRTAHFGIDVWETKSITQTDETMTFKGVFVQRELDTESYSTICLPFNLTTLEGTPYEGASVLKFDKAEDSDVAGDNRTFLTFKEVTFTNGDIMEAGKPYLIKVNTPIAKGAEKIFKNVTCPPIGTQGQSVKKGAVTFHGMLNPTTFTKEQIKDKLFLTADNRLVSLYGNNEFSINGLRGYFTVIGATQNVEFVLNLPEKVTTSIPMVNIADSLQVTKYLWDGKIYIQKGNEVYDLSGARVK